MSILVPDRTIQARGDIATFPDGFVLPPTEAEVTDAQSWLNECGDVTTVGLLLRMTPKYASELERLCGAGHRFDVAIEESAMRSLERVKSEWERILHPDSVWNGILAFTGIHACALRGPAGALQEFLQSEVVCGPRGSVAGVFVSEAVRTPEAEDLIAEGVAETQAQALLQEILPRALSAARRSDAAANEREFLMQFEMQAASLGPRIRSLLVDAYRAMMNLMTNDDEEEQIESCLAAGDSYLNDLGIGEFGHWGDDLGKSQTACIIDSGADESHPMLQRQVRDYVRFDFAGQQKEAYACVDNACHGTKIASLICGKRMLGSDLRHSDLSQSVRVGVAPGSRIVAVSALGGGFKRECGSIAQVLAGLDWASRNASRLGFEVVNLSIEPGYEFPLSDRQKFDRLLDLMTRGRHLVPILASGNGGEFSRTLGTRATRVGAADRNGNAVQTNGPEADLLAPGRHILCAQPGTSLLKHRLLGCYCGSSLAAAIVSGAILALSQRHRCSAAASLGAIKASAQPNGFINIDSADRLL